MGGGGVFRVVHGRGKAGQDGRFIISQRAAAARVDVLAMTS